MKRGIVLGFGVSFIIFMTVLMSIIFAKTIDITDYVSSIEIGMDVDDITEIFECQPESIRELEQYKIVEWKDFNDNYVQIVLKYGMVKDLKAIWSNERYDVEYFDYQSSMKNADEIQEKLKQLIEER